MENSIWGKGLIMEEKVKKIYEYIERCKDSEKIIIYGAGILGHLLQKRLEEKYNVRIDYFCTSFEPNHVDEATGLEVLNREQLRRHTNALYIIALGITYSRKVYEEIREYLIQIGVHQDKIITDTSDWIIYEAKPYINAEGKLNVFTLSYHVTKQCNLKCKMCGQLLFGLVPRRSFPAEQIMGDMHTVFEIIDRIEILKLIGGEVMVYPKLDELIDLINIYHEQVGLLEIYTNGAVVPNAKVLGAITRYNGNIQITISDYGDLSIAKNKWISFGREYNIKINILGFTSKDKAGYKGWIDCTKIEDLKENEEKIRQKYITCGQRLDYVLEDSILGKCTSFHMINYALHKELSRNESLYINDDISIEEKRHRVLKLGADDNYLEICKYCVWGSDIRNKLPRYPAAEQLDKITS